MGERNTEEEIRSRGLEQVRVLYEQARERDRKIDAMLKWWESKRAEDDIHAER